MYLAGVVLIVHVQYVVIMPLFALHFDSEIYLDFDVIMSLIENPNKEIKMCVCVLGRLEQSFTQALVIEV